MDAPSILFEDTHLAVLSKPAGMLSQGDSSGEPSLVDWLQNHFGRKYVGLIHRLDRNTSGAMVIAKRSKSANRLTEALQSGALERNYLAWITGSLRMPKAWSHFLLKDERTNRTRVVPPTAHGAKAARLSVIPVYSAYWGTLPVTLAEFILDTGRSHQIRVQAAHEGYSLLGDIKYGKPNAEGADFGRPALHSSRISFPHPMSEEILKFEAPLPNDMDQTRFRSIQPLR